MNLRILPWYLSYVVCWWEREGEEEVLGHCTYRPVPGRCSSPCITPHTTQRGQGVERELNVCVSCGPRWRARGGTELAGNPDALFFIWRCKWNKVPSSIFFLSLNMQWLSWLIFVQPKRDSTDILFMSGHEKERQLLQLLVPQSWPHHYRHYGCPPIRLQVFTHANRNTPRHETTYTNILIVWEGDLVTYFPSDLWLYISL